MEGDIVAWAPVDIEDVKVGDVIVFKSHIHWPDEKIVVHRVTKLERDSNGNLILETKGDNNEWTDQAGPHIPEPYIRESNLMGKVLSIGQQPLKIPFVGYLGVWINEGLQSLSQPTSQKGSLSYIGIFAPLTISVVVLVILLFILPEKARTIKEKIHLNIFGRKPLNLKKTLISFLVIYIVFLTVIHCFAYDSITASLGVDEKSPDSSLNFGRVSPGSESKIRELPTINPGTMPVRGIIFGTGEVSEFVARKTFELQTGEEKTTTLTAYASNQTVSGTYLGDIRVYSSPFWLIFPEDFMQNILNWNAEATVFILDFLTALILTSITISMLLSVTFIGDKTTSWIIDKSWQRPSRLILKKGVIEKGSRAKNKMKQAIGKSMAWIVRVDFSKIKSKETIFSSIGKPILATLVIIPVLFFLEDEILAMFIAVVIAGLLAYLLSCKIRKKIVLTVIITMSMAITYMIIQSNIIIISQQNSTIEIMALASGAIGIYLLLFAILLIPLALISWFVVRLIRNLKERKDPLLSLEGRCDL